MDLLDPDQIDRLHPLALDHDRIRDRTGEHAVVVILLREVNRQHITGSRRQDLCGRESAGGRSLDFEVQQVGPRDLVLFVYLEQQQVHLDERDQPRIDPAANIKDMNRSQREVLGQLAPTNTTVAIVVMQVEIDAGEDPAPHSRFGNQ